MKFSKNGSDLIAMDLRYIVYLLHARFCFEWGSDSTPAVVADSAAVRSAMRLFLAEQPAV